jgi:hypothetical protein
MADIDERDAIFQHFVDLCGNVTGVQLVSEDIGQVVVHSVDQFPAIFVIDLGDKTDNADVRPGGGYTENTLTIGFWFVYQGSTAAEARRELATFQVAFKQEFYGHAFDSEYVDSVMPIGRSHVAVRKDDPTIVEQMWQVDVQFVENIHLLLS